MTDTLREPAEAAADSLVALVGVNDEGNKSRDDRLEQIVAAILGQTEVIRGAGVVNVVLGDAVETIKGADGRDGETGPQGPHGDIGPPGTDGEQGPQGDEGPQGPQGDPGEKGDNGPPGPKGSRGDPGENGEKGDTGDRGPRGFSGPSGFGGGGGGSLSVTDDGASPQSIDVLDIVSPLTVSVVGRIAHVSGPSGGGGGYSPPIPQSDVTNLVTDLAAKVPTSRTITAGTGLTGGGDLSANRTLAADFGSVAGKVTQGDDARLSDSRAPTGPAGGDLSGTYPNPSVVDDSHSHTGATAPGSQTLDETLALSGGEDIADALSGAAAPDAGNPFATMADVGTGLTNPLTADLVTDEFILRAANTATAQGGRIETLNASGDDGGDITVTGGAGDPDNGVAGEGTFEGGNGWEGGKAYLVGGSSLGAGRDGAYVEVRGGAANGSGGTFGGNVQVIAGLGNHADSTGGDSILRGGSSQGSGAYAEIKAEGMPQGSGNGFLQIITDGSDGAIGDVLTKNASNKAVWAALAALIAAADFSGLPTADPAVAGQLWNNFGVLMVSAG